MQARLKSSKLLQNYKKKREKIDYFGGSVWIWRWQPRGVPAHTLVDLIPENPETARSGRIS